jgi:hypothetical protein
VVREKRGAGAGCSTRLTLTKALRARLCGWRGASDHDSTGAKQASEPSNTFTHSSRVFALKAAAKAALCSGHLARSCCGKSFSASCIRFRNSW